jgi:hypothetical protein
MNSCVLTGGSFATCVHTLVHSNLTIGKQKFTLAASGCIGDALHHETECTYPAFSGRNSSVSCYPIIGGHKRSGGKADARGQFETSVEGTELIIAPTEASPNPDNDF